MTKFWDRVLDLILSKGQRERHEKYLWDKQFGGNLPSQTSPCGASTLDRTISPEYRPTLKPMLPTPKITPTTSVVFQVTTTNIVADNSPSTSPTTPVTSPINSRNGSPTHPNPLTKSMGGGAPRALLPRHLREDRAYISLDPLMEAHKRSSESISEKKEYSSSKSSPPKLEKPGQKRPLLYEVPPLSQTEGVGRFRRSVNATDEFIDSALKRKDSFTDLMAWAVGEKPRTGSGEWPNPGNMDTTSPPPPRKAFSRNNSPVRLAIYGDNADEVAEEELEERDGKLIFGRRKSKTKTLSTSAKDSSTSDKENPENPLVATSDPGVTTTEVRDGTQKGNAGKKRQPVGPLDTREEEPARGRRQKAESKSGVRNGGNLRRNTSGRIRQATSSEEVSEALESEFEDVEEVESFSERGKMAKAVTGSGKTREKERTARAPEPTKRGRRVTRGQGATATKAGAARRLAMRK